MRPFKWAFFICSFFLLTQGVALASKPRVLVIGDSQSQRKFGQEVFAGLDQDYEVHSYALCGASAVTWNGSNGPETMRELCGVPKEKDPITQLHSGGSETPGLTTQALARGEGLFEEALKHHRPDLVLIQLGDNMTNGYTGEISRAQVETQVLALVEKLDELAPNIPACRWVAPTFGESKSEQRPGWNKDSEQVREINDIIEETLLRSGHKCEIVRGDNPELKRALGSDYTVDGLHLGDSAAREWAKHVLSRVPGLRTEASGTRPCPVDTVEPLPSEAQDLLNDIRMVTASLEDDSNYTPPDLKSIKRDQDNNRMFASAYNYGPADYNVKSLSPAPKSGGFFAGLGSFFSGLFQGIGNFFSSLFSGITGLFGSSTLSNVPAVGITQNEPISKDPLERTSSNLMSYYQDDGRAPASEALDEVSTAEIPGSRGFTMTYEKNKTPMQNPVMIGGFRYDNRFDQPPAPSELEVEDHYSPSAAPVNLRLSEADLDDEEGLLSGAKRPGANTWLRLNELSKNAFNKGGEGQCRAQLNQAYDDIPGGAIWGALSLEERADRIKAHADISIRKIRETSANQPGAARTNSPHNISPYLSGNVAMCISFIETRGTLNPHVMNYTMCQPRNSGRWSTASGLGQMTRTTFRGLHDQNLIPITTTDDYEGASRDELFYAITDDVTLQMEVLLRYMNYEIKRASRFGGSEEEIMLRAVAAYDQDNQSRYVRMYSRCHRCMKSLGQNEDPMHCYREMGK